MKERQAPSKAGGARGDPLLSSPWRRRLRPHRPAIRTGHIIGRRRYRTSDTCPAQPSDARLGVDGYGAEMGGSSSRELEAAQLQVRKLTRELEKVSRKVAQAAPASSALQAAAEKSAAEKAAAAAAAAEQKAREELLAKDRELEMTAMKLKGMAPELPKIKEVAQKNAQELESVKREKAQKDSQLKTLKDELKASKEELEALFGKLKFAEAEGAAVRKLKAELSGEGDSRRAAAGGG